MSASSASFGAPQTNYLRDGFVVVPGLLGTSALELAFHRFFSGAPSQWNLDYSRFQQICHPLSALFEESAPLLLDALASIAEECTGYRVRLFVDQLFFRPGGCEVPTAWHQDEEYWKRFGPVEGTSGAITAWFPLGDVSEEQSCMEVIPGSHRFAEVRYAVQQSLSPHFASPPLAAEIDETLVVKLPMRRGDVLFMHGALLHGAGPNRASSPRVAVSMHFFRDV